jgi:hypothetical protein
MKNYDKELEDMRAMVSEMQKKLTMMSGEKVEPDQDGNRGDSQEVTGEVDYSKFDNLAKKKLLKQKMIAGM